MWLVDVAKVTRAVYQTSAAVARRRERGFGRTLDNVIPDCGDYRRETPMAEPDASTPLGC